MRHFLVTMVCLTLFLSMPKTAESQGVPDTEQIRELFEGLTQAWKQGDGTAWGNAFLPDADFTVWFGLHMEGREAISEGHQFIFDRFYAGTVFELEIKKVRFLTSNVAVVHLTGSVVTEGQQAPEVPDAVPMAVATRTDEGWKIAAFQNTPFVVNEFRRNGDLRQFKKSVGDKGAP